MFSIGGRHLHEAYRRHRRSAHVTLSAAMKLHAGTARERSNSGPGVDLGLLRKHHATENNVRLAIQSERETPVLNRNPTATGINPIRWNKSRETSLEDATRDQRLQI